MDFNKFLSGAPTKASIYELYLGSKVLTNLKEFEGTLLDKNIAT
jgi:hypothetical protein